MKIIRKFMKDNSSVEFPDEIMADYENINTTEDYVVRFMGETWEFQFYGTIQHPTAEAELIYTVQKTNPLWPSPQPTITYGPHSPHEIKCGCGSASVGHPGHATYCDVINKTGWDEAIKEYLELRKQFDNIQLEDQNVYGSLSYMLRNSP